VSGRRRRSGLALAVTVVVAAVVTGRLFDAPPGAARAGRLAYVLAAVLVAGALLSGGPPQPHRSEARPFFVPALRGVALFAVFVVLGWLSVLFPPVHHGVRTLLRYADARPFWPTALAAATAGVAEEVFYRGAVFEKARLPLVTATLAHAVTTLPAGNLALTLSTFVLGSVLGHSRRRTGGWWAPALTHAVWSVLVVAWLPR
jgi:membrane protease YdiL (CAAX protease family)